ERSRQLIIRNHVALAIDQVLSLAAQITNLHYPRFNLLLDSSVPLLNDRIAIIGKIAIAYSRADIRAGPAKGTGLGPLRQVIAERERIIEGELADEVLSTIEGCVQSRVGLESFGA